VTFQQIDPFFVIDISGDTPRILGELKIPGFSNYLHPYDEDHIIGVGRDTTLHRDWVEQLGVKLSMFNVADVSNPVDIDNFIIGNDAVYSPALDNHKAFFFDKPRDLISLPILGPDYALDGVAMSSMLYDEWYGFYIIDVNDNKRFDLRGTITHQSMYGWGDWYRTFYIEDVLYTVSDSILSANDIDTLKTIKTVQLRGTGSMIGFAE